MDKNTLNQVIACYIINIGTKGIPNSHVWLAVQEIEPEVDLEMHCRLLVALKASDLIKESNYFLTLLPKGVEMLDKIQRALFRERIYSGMSQAEKNQAHAAQTHQMMDDGA